MIICANVSDLTSLSTGPASVPAPTPSERGEGLASKPIDFQPAASAFSTCGHSQRSPPPSSYARELVAMPLRLGQRRPPRGSYLAGASRPASGPLSLSLSRRQDGRRPRPAPGPARGYRPAWGLPGLQPMDLYRMPLLGRAAARVPIHETARCAVERRTSRLPILQAFARLPSADQVPEGTGWVWSAYVKPDCWNGHNRTASRPSRAAFAAAAAASAASAAHRERQAQASSPYKEVAPRLPASSRGRERDRQIAVGPP
eukprot:355508-Chlamydomonas_euryale.AAC.10